jgi:hypothetical protein
MENIGWEAGTKSPSFVLSYLWAKIPTKIPRSARGINGVRPLAFLRGMRMAVTLHVRITTAEGRQVYHRPAYTANKKLRAGYALVKGKPVEFPDATFVLRYVEEGKRRWKAVGKDPAEAIAAKIRREHLERGREIGPPVSYDTQPATPESNKRLITVATETYLTSLAKTSKDTTLRAEVLQLGVEELIRSEIDKITAGNFQVAAERTGSDPHGGRLVFAVFSVVPGCRRTPGRARLGHGSRDGLALGAEIRAGTGAAAAGSFETHE